MRNSTCIICKNEFEPREGKLYCSNACKQRAYLDNKENIKLVGEIEHSRKIKKERLTFYFIEYQKFCEKYPKGIPNFQLYCFFRKNVVGNPTIEQMNDYIDSFDGHWWDEFWDCDRTGKVSPARKRYEEFEAEFFSDNIVLYLGESNANPQPII